MISARRGNVSSLKLVLCFAITVEYTCKPRAEAIETVLRTSSVTPDVVTFGARSTCWSYSSVGRWIGPCAGILADRFYVDGVGGREDDRYLAPGSGNTGDASVKVKARVQLNDFVRRHYIDEPRGSSPC